VIRPDGLLATVVRTADGQEGKALDDGRFMDILKFGPNLEVLRPKGFRTAVADCLPTAAGDTWKVDPLGRLLTGWEWYKGVQGGGFNMKLDSVEQIFRALNTAGVRYLVAGGLAVNAHGYLRFTKDVDLVVQLLPDNIERTFTALGGLGYRPNVPVSGEQFADPEQRAGWIHEKHLQVLQLWSDAQPETPVDLFASEPFPFDSEYERALHKPLYGDIEVRFVALDTLIRMKQVADRVEDRTDIEHLRIIQDGNDG